MSSTTPGLRALREQLGLRIETAAREASLSPARLKGIENDVDDASVDEIEALAAVYGVDADLLWDEGAALSPNDSLRTLASLDEFKDVSDHVRLRIIRVAAAVRDLVTLQGQLGEGGRATAFRKTRPAFKADARKAGTPYIEGAHYALQFRRALHLGSHPIPSVGGLLHETFPALNIVYADLTADGPAALCFSDQARGPSIVVNVRGKNENLLVRRFSLLHELFHLLVDWGAGKDLVELSGFLSETGLAREQRANAFAIRVLCPEAVLKRATPSELADYGVHYAALRLYMRNVTGTELPLQPPLAFMALVNDPRWAQAEGKPEDAAPWPCAPPASTPKESCNEMPSRACWQSRRPSPSSGCWISLASTFPRKPPRELAPAGRRRLHHHSKAWPPGISRGPAKAAAPHQHHRLCGDP